jgi:hypothetical protein
VRNQNPRHTYVCHLPQIHVCFNGPKCMAPFNETGTPSCFDDKVGRSLTAAQL